MTADSANIVLLNENGKSIVIGKPHYYKQQKYLGTIDSLNQMLKEASPQSLYICADIPTSERLEIPDSVETLEITGYNFILNLDVFPRLPKGLKHLVLANLRIDGWLVQSVIDLPKLSNIFIRMFEMNGSMIINMGSDSSVVDIHIGVRQKCNISLKCPPEKIVEFEYYDTFDGISKMTRVQKFYQCECQELPTHVMHSVEVNGVVPKNILNCRANELTIENAVMDNFTLNGEMKNIKFNNCKIQTFDWNGQTPNSICIHSSVINAMIGTPKFLKQYLRKELDYCTGSKIVIKSIMEKPIQLESSEGFPKCFATVYNTISRMDLWARLAVETYGTLGMLVRSIPIAVYILSKIQGDFTERELDTAIINCMNSTYNSMRELKMFFRIST